MSSSGILNLDLKNIRLPAWLTLGSPAAAGPGLKANYPPIAMDMGISQFALARLAREKEKGWTLTSYDLVEVPPDLLDSDFYSMKVKSADQYRALVAGAMRKEGVATDRISLVLPDHLAKVALLPFEELPRSRREVVEMVRWKMKKAVPFKVEEAVVDYQVLPAATGGGFTLLVVLMPRGILEEHESVFSGQNVRVGLVDLSTFSVVHLYRAVIDKEVPADGDFMVLNATRTFFTVMIFRAGTPIFYRCKTFAFGGDRDGESDHRFIHREIQASILYYQERLDGKSLARVYMRLIGHTADRVVDLFREAPVEARPELVDVRRVVGVTGRFTAAGSDRTVETLQRLAPAVGAAIGRDA